jgi:hypothetical protein
VTTWTHERAVLANATRRGDVQAAAEARERLRAARFEERVRQLVDSAPPLTNEQRDRLALLLRGSAA